MYLTHKQFRDKKRFGQSRFWHLHPPNHPSTPVPSPNIGYANQINVSEVNFLLKMAQLIMFDAGLILLL